MKQISDRYLKTFLSLLWVFVVSIQLRDIDQMGSRFSTCFLSVSVAITFLCTFLRIFEFLSAFFCQLSFYHYLIFNLAGFRAAFSFVFFCDKCILFYGYWSAFIYLPNTHITITIGIFAFFLLKSGSSVLLFLIATFLKTNDVISLERKSRIRVHICEVVYDVLVCVRATYHFKICFSK